jgi:hypothetical protein
MTHEIPKSTKSTDCAFFTFTGTPTLSNPLTPVLVGSSTGAGITVSSNDIDLPVGEYILRFFGAITRTTGTENIKYQWREVGGALLGVEGATNREEFVASHPASMDSADAHLVVGGGGTSVQVEITLVDAGVTLDTSNSHALVWRVS